MKKNYDACISGDRDSAALTKRFIRHNKFIQIWLSGILQLEFRIQSPPLEKGDLGGFGASREKSPPPPFSKGGRKTITGFFGITRYPNSKWMMNRNHFVPVVEKQSF